MKIGSGEEDGVHTDTKDPYPAFPQDITEPLQVIDRIKLASEIKAIGNAEFKQANWGVAVQKYNKVCMAFLNCVTGDPWRGEH